MNHDFHSHIAHYSHDFCNPMGEGTAAAILDRLATESPAACLDVGAGKGELLIRILEGGAVTGVAVERSPWFAGEIRRRAEARLPEGKLTLLEGDAEGVLAAVAPGGFDLGLCLGSSHALGGLEATLAAFRRLVHPGGRLLIGEGYWRRSPDPEYLQALGASPEDLGTHDENLARFARLGFRTAWSRTASDEEWTRYETRYRDNVLAFVRDHPDHPDAEAMERRAREWWAVVERWGLSTLGFGFYLLES